MDERAKVRPIDGEDKGGGDTGENTRESYREEKIGQPKVDRRHETSDRRRGGGQWRGRKKAKVRE